MAAANSWAVIERDGAHVWSGYTDANGCTPVLAGTAGNYVHWRTTALHKNGTNIFVRPTNNNNWQWFTQSIPISGGVPNGTTWTYTPSLGYGENVASVFAVMTELSKRSDMGVKPIVYNAYANQDCPAGGFAGCFDGSALYLGDDNFGNDMAFVKYVVSHEMGHYVQRKMFGSLSFGYGQNAPTSQPLCRCDHVVTSNQEHCMQSREDIEAAEIEGWAHFFATDLLNDNSSTDPVMVYYKEFLSIFGMLNPPMALHFGSPVRWMESFCPASNRGTEADWTAFLWDINNKGSYKYSFDNLEMVYEEACGGTCFSDTVEWPDLKGAADNVFGASSNKAFRFRDTGMAHGVDN